MSTKLWFLPVILVIIVVGYLIYKYENPRSNIKFANTSDVSATVDDNSLDSNSRTISGTIKGSDRVCITLHSGNIDLPAYNIKNLLDIPHYLKRQCNLENSTRWISLSDNIWKVKVFCPTIIPNGSYTVGVYIPGTYPNGQINWNSGKLIESKHIDVSDAMDGAQCSTDEKAIQLQDGKIFEISSRDASDRSINMNFLIKKITSCTEAKTMSNETYVLDSGNGTKETLRAHVFGGFIHDLSTCEITWSKTVKYTNSGEYEISLYKSDKILEKFPITVVLSNNNLNAKVNRGW